METTGAATPSPAATARVRYHILPILGATLLVLAAIVYVAVRLNRQVASEMLDRYQREQIIAVSQQSERLRVVLESIRQDLVWLSRHPDIRTMEEEKVRPLLSEFYRMHSGSIGSGSLMDGDCVIRYVEGGDRSGEGRNIGDQAHVKKLFATRAPVVSGSFLAVQGYHAVAIHAPIIKDGEVIGSVATVVNWESFESWFRLAETSPGSYMTLIDPDGYVIYHPDRERVGKTFTDTDEGDGSAHPKAKRAVGGSHAEVVNRAFFGDEPYVVASSSFRLGDGLYSLMSCAPFADILGPLHQLSRMTAILGGLALLVVALALAYGARVVHRDRVRSLEFQRDLEEEIRDRLSAEERLRIYKEIFEKSNDAIAVIDADGHFREQNEAHRRLTGYSLDELREKTPAVHMGENKCREVLGAIEERGSFRGELESTGKSGEKTPIELSAFKMVAPGGQGNLRVGISRDVTERRRAEEQRTRLEEQLRQAEKLRAIGELAGGIAHDFNNRLTGIMGYAELLARSSADPDHKRYADTIVNSSAKAAQLTEQLLAFARKGRMQAAPVDIHHVIEDVESLLKHTVDKRIRIRKELEADSSTVFGDPSQLESALLNLAINACDAMPEGGELLFGTKVLVGDTADPACPPPGRYLELTVADTGVGMDEETKKRIFEPFFTTKRLGEGTGMGLAAVYGTVQSHRGDIRFDARPGEGATFTIRLPLSEEAPPLTEAPASAPPVRGNARILLADDERQVRDLTCDMLRDLGYQPVACEDGLQAVEMYRREWRDIDLVILDLIMPEMKGGEAFRAMREINPEVKVIISSGSSIEGGAREILAEGAQMFLAKPFRIGELSRALAAVLGPAPE